MRMCSEEGCGNAHYGHGLCDKHYQRLRKYGSTNPAGIHFQNRRRGECSEVDCKREPRGNTLCRMHNKAVARARRGKLPPKPRAKRPVELRVAGKISLAPEPGGCWLWTASVNNRGYGVIGTDAGKRVYVHRFIYAMAFGEIPSGKEICHRCDNPRCVRPAHLMAGTHQDNMQDMIRRGRARRRGRIIDPSFAKYPERERSSLEDETADRLVLDRLGMMQLPIEQAA